MPIKPMSPSAAVEEATDIISACFEGFMLGRDGKFSRIHPEIQDEFRAVVRSALSSVLAWAAEECRPKKKSERKIEWNFDIREVEKAESYNDALDAYRVALLKAAEEIGGV